MYNIHPTDFLIFSFDREVPQSKVLFQCPLKMMHPLFIYHKAPTFTSWGFDIS